MSKLSGEFGRQWREMQRATCAHIWQILDDSGVPQEVIAKYLECHPQYLTDLRFGQVPMSSPMRAKISQLIGVDETELFGEYLRRSEALKKER